MGFENNIINSLDRRNPGEHPVIAKMHEKATALLARDAVDPHHFVDLYGEENVGRDLQKVETSKAKFETDDIKRAAEVFEAIIYQHTELSDWLGSNAETIRPSEFDDIVNGIDLIVEFNNEDSTKHLALGVDVTFGTTSMAKKFDRIKSEIDKDELAKVKYFESHGFKGSLRQIPRIVIGVEKDTVIALAGLWMRNENAELGNHFAKDIITKEIEQQLQAFLTYAKSIGAENAIKSYTQAIATMRNVKMTSTPTQYNRSKVETVDSDRVFKDIQGYLKNFQVASPQ